MSLIRFHDVTKKYENNQVLRNVYFRLNQGERVGLVGKNGAGKTTVIKLILKQEEPTAGVVEVAKQVQIGYFSQFSEFCRCVVVRAVAEAGGKVPPLLFLMIATFLMRL